jgi:hypothetical protein
MPDRFPDLVPDGYFSGGARLTRDPDGRPELAIILRDLQTAWNERWGASAEGTTGTTSASWRRKLRWAPPAGVAMAAGVYVVEWYAELLHADEGTDALVRLRADNAAILATHNVEPKDAANWMPMSGFAIVTFAAGTHTVDMDFRNEIAGILTRVRRARIQVRRIA